MQIKGKIKGVLELKSGTSAAGKDWKKQEFLLETTEEYNNLYCFEIFGEEKVDNFVKYNKVGSDVEVDFNVKTNEWKGRYFTTLDAWKIFSLKSETAAASPSAPEAEPEGADDLPF